METMISPLDAEGWGGETLLVKLHAANEHHN